MTAVRIAGGSRCLAVRYAPLMLQGSARTWLNSLPRDSINCCEDFQNAFVHNFTSTYERTNLPRQLALCVQGRDEPLRDYLSRWIKLKNSCEGVHEIQVIQYFTDGCLADSMLKHKLLRKDFTSLAELMKVANQFAVSDSAMRPIQLGVGGVLKSPGAPQSKAGNQGLSRKERKENNRNNNINNNQQNNSKRKDEQPDTQYGSRQVAAVQNEEDPGAAGGSRKPKPNVRPPGQMKPKYTFDDMLDAPCKLHSTPGRPSAHTTRQCDFVRRIAKGEALPPPPPPPPQNRGPPQQQNQFPRQDAAYMIFTSESTDKGSRRARAQEVNATMPLIPQYMHWSECEISWGRPDHPTILPNPGNYPLVVNALFAGPKFSCKFSRVLVDGGSTINILYRDTLTKLGLTEKDLERSRTTFHGIVPGLSCTPMGRIRLDVIFGTEENFRREPIWFEVADLSSPYHALLGMPAFAKFMLNAHETYLKMKMPGPNGVITVIGDFRKSLECTSASGNLGDSQVIAEEKRQLSKVIAMAQAQSKVPLPFGPAKRSDEESAFQSAKDSKKVALDPSDSTKFVVVGAGLSNK